MLLQVASKKYFVDFSHCTQGSWLKQPGETLGLPNITCEEFHIKLDNGATECLIWNGDDLQDGKPYRALSGGIAYCSTEDIFSKRKGRKVSLTKALEAFSRSERAAIWQAYWAVMPQDREGAR